MKFKLRGKQKENKLSEETALGQVNTLLEYYDIDPGGLPEKELKAVEYALTRIQKAVSEGRLEIKEADGSIHIEQTLKNGEKLVYQELNGRAKMAQKGADENDNNGKIYALMGSLSGVGLDGIANLKGKDLGLVENLGALFLFV